MGANELTPKVRTIRKSSKNLNFLIFSSQNFKHLSGSFGPAGQWSLGKVSLGLSKRQPKYECTYKMKPDSLPRMTALTEQLTNMANGIYCIL